MGEKVRARVIIAALFWGGLARAGGGPPTDAYDGDGIGERPVEAHLFADLYVQHDFNLPASGRVQLRAFDSVDGPSLGLLGVTLARRPRRVGFRIDAGVGDLADAYVRDDPSSVRQPELARWLSRVQQAFVTVALPLGGGLQLDAGKYDTPIGFEDNRSFTNWSYSRSLLFTFAEPSVHLGLRATYKLGKRAAVALFWNNGWNANFFDGSAMRSYAVAGRWQPRPQLELVLVYAGGLERPPSQPTDPTLAFRHLLAVYARYAPTAKLTLVLAGDYGHDAARGGVGFGGVAAYVSVPATRWLRVSARGELLADPQGFATGTAQSVGEVTATVEGHGQVHRLALSIRLEVRHDHSTARFFQHDGGARPFQDTITLAVLASY